MLQRDIEPGQAADIDKFDRILTGYLAGEVDEDVFRVFRLTNGIYGQRQGGHNQMLRVRIPYGGVTPEQLDAFAHLSEENLRFLENFIRYRGNVKEMERELGQSYWTIRSRLDKVIGEMGLSSDPPDLEEQRKQILKQLSDGEIDVDEATQKLSNLGKK